MRIGQAWARSSSNGRRKAAGSGPQGRLRGIEAESKRGLPRGVCEGTSDIHVLCWLRSRTAR
eukprot:1905513-Alexandrium_andersonii.AAC.1